MFERELTKDLSGVGRIIPTKLGISRPTLTCVVSAKMLPLQLSWTIDL